MNVKKGLLVTRRKYGNDIVFRIYDIKENIIFLKGEIVRLIATSTIEDIEEYDIRKKISTTLPYIEKDNSLLKGRILHIDGDEYYLKKAIEAYKGYGLEAYGYFIEERDLPSSIGALLKKHKVDILVLTGHDSLRNKNNPLDVGSYQNSSYFIEACKIARSIIPSKDELVIIGGACQSYYEELIKAGANFASSPRRNNIHLFDPVIIASLLACSSCKSYVDVTKILDLTISKEMGGIDTKGIGRTMYSIL